MLRMVPLHGLVGLCACTLPQLFTAAHLMFKPSLKRRSRPLNQEMTSRYEILI